MNEEKKKQAALEFAQTQPIRWDAFLAKWLKEHSEPTETVEPEVAEPEPIEPVATSPEATVEVEETVEVAEVKKRKVVPRKVKAADS